MRHLFDWVYSCEALMQSSTPKPLLVIIALWSIGLITSGWSPFDRTTWWLEVIPCFIGLAVMWATKTKFPLTDLLYALILIHGLILMLGGAYTYARVPLGFWMQDWFGFGRNNYDKIGHFAQGFVPAIIARWGRMPMNFSEPKATLGTPSRTCLWRWLAQSRRWSR